MPSIKIVNGLNMEQIGNTIDMSKGKSVEKIMDEFKTEVVKGLTPVIDYKSKYERMKKLNEELLNDIDELQNKVNYLEKQKEKKEEPKTEQVNPELFADAEEDEPVIKAFPVESDSSEEEEEDEIQEKINMDQIWKQLIEDLNKYGITKASKSQNFALNRNLGKGHIYKIHTTKKSIVIRFFNDKHLTKEVGKNIFPKQN